MDLGRLEAVLFHLAVWDRFGSSWGRFGMLLGRLGLLLGLPCLSSLFRFWVLLGLWGIILGLCWGKMGPIVRLPYIPSALFRTSHQPCAFMAFDVS